MFFVHSFAGLCVVVAAAAAAAVFSFSKTLFGWQIRQRNVLKMLFLVWCVVAALFIWTNKFIIQAHKAFNY